MFMVEWLRINSLTRISTFVIQPGTWRFFSFFFISCTHLLIHSLVYSFIYLLVCLLGVISTDFHLLKLSMFDDDALHS